MRFSQKQRRAPVINIISLIDILCILLIFFIVTTVFRRPEPMVKITVPPSAKATNVAERDKPPATLYVTKTGDMFLDGDPVEPSRLAALLKQRKAQSPDFRVALKADEDTPFKAIVRINDAASEAGIGTLPTYMDEKRPAGR